MSGIGRDVEEAWVRVLLGELMDAVIVGADETAEFGLQARA